MSANTTPSVNPADDSSLVGAVKIAVRKALQNTDVMMPVEVVAYDRATNRATLKHLIPQVATDGTEYDRANIASVRVYQPGNGAFSMSLPIKPGDRGWIMAADRDISTFQQSLEKSAPNTARMHSFQDGLFMPDAMGMGDVPAGEGDRVVIGANGGGTILSFDDSGFYFSVGGTTFALTAAGLEITGGDVKHNGTSIGDTHKHSGVVPGGANTGDPI